MLGNYDSALSNARYLIHVVIYNYVNLNFQDQGSRQLHYLTISNFSHANLTMLFAEFTPFANILVL